MRQALVLLLFSGFAAAACQNLPYHDFTWASSYQQPQRPPDTLLDDCGRLDLSDPSLCNLIQNPGFSEYDKKRLLLDDLAKDVGQPPFSAAESWVNALIYTAYAPDGVTAKNGPYIKNAWVAITGITPSLAKPDGKTYVNDSGTLFLAFNFSFVVPKETFAGDCRTDYEICGYDYSLIASGNGRILPRIGLTASFRSDDRNDFSAALSINSQYLIHHYKLVCHCHGFSCTWTCDYIWAEDRRDAVSVTSDKTAFRRQTPFSADVFVDGFQDGLLDAWLTINSPKEFNRVRLDAGSSWLEIKNSEYRLDYSLAPYNALYAVSSASTRPLRTHELSVLSRTTENNAETIHFLAPASSPNCSLVLVSDFQQIYRLDACFFNASQSLVLDLAVVNASNESFTAIANFYDNLTRSPLAGETIEFTYGDHTLSTPTDGTGRAVVSFDYSYGTNLVYAEFKTDFQVKSARAIAVVPASAPDIVGMALFWLGIAVGAWLLYLFARRVFG